MHTLTKNVALHWATEGVRVNLIQPRFIAAPPALLATATVCERQTLSDCRWALPRDRPGYAVFSRLSPDGC